MPSSAPQVAPSAPSQVSTKPVAPRSSASIIDARLRARLKIMDWFSVTTFAQRRRAATDINIAALEKALDVLVALPVDHPLFDIFDNRPTPLLRPDLFDAADFNGSAPVSLQCATEAQKIIGGHFKGGAPYQPKGPVLAVSSPAALNERVGGYYRPASALAQWAIDTQQHLGQQRCVVRPAGVSEATALLAQATKHNPYAELLVGTESGAFEFLVSSGFPRGLIVERTSPLGKSPACITAQEFELGFHKSSRTGVVLLQDLGV